MNGVGKENFPRTAISNIPNRPNRAYSAFRESRTEVQDTCPVNCVLFLFGDPS